MITRTLLFLLALLGLAHPATAATAIDPAVVATDVTQQDWNGPRPILSFRGDPDTLQQGASLSLSWTSKYVSNCTARGGWTGARPINGSQIQTPSVTTRYTLVCSGPSGSVYRSVTATVIPAPKPTVTMTANPTSVASGGSSSLTWSSTNATGCSASGGWTGAKATSGSQSTGALSSTTSFTLSCSGAGGDVNRSSTVTVTNDPAPTVTLTASPTTVASGGSSTLTWSSTNATSCAASGGWTGAKAASGAQATGALTGTSIFTLICSGLGGSASDSMTVTVGGIGPAFPLHVEGGKRYLIDAAGQPFFMNGDTPWDLIASLRREDVDVYLENRRLKGINTILVELIERQFSPNPPNNAYGDAPFTTPGDFGTPSEAYFAHAEYVIAKARSKGILVLITPAYMGYEASGEGWYQEMVANGEAKMYAFGQYVANRFKAYDNILWVEGGDYNPPEKVLLRAVANGIRDVTPNTLQTFGGARGTSALAYLGTSEPWLTVNNIYTNESTVVANAFLEYGRSTMPFFLIEARYEGETTGTELVARLQAYQAVLSGAFGHLYGNNPVWQFGSGWQAALNAPGAVSLTHLRTLIDAFAWWTLVPDTGNTFLTAGIGAGGSRAVSAKADSGAFAMIYTPAVRTLTISVGQMAGPNVRARWYDPTNGTYVTVAGSPFAASGSLTFTPTGNNSAGLGDWVLVLQSQ